MLVLSTVSIGLAALAAGVLVGHASTNAIPAVRRAWMRRTAPGGASVKERLSKLEALMAQANSPERKGLEDFERLVHGLGQQVHALHTAAAKQATGFLEMQHNLRDDLQQLQARVDELVDKKPTDTEAPLKALEAQVTAMTETLNRQGQYLESLDPYLQQTLPELLTRAELAEILGMAGGEADPRSPG